VPFTLYVCWLLRCVYCIYVVDCTVGYTLFPFVVVTHGYVCRFVARLRLDFAHVYVVRLRYVYHTLCTVTFDCPFTCVDLLLPLFVHAFTLVVAFVALLRCVCVCCAHV